MTHTDTNRKAVAVLVIAPVLFILGLLFSWAAANA